jgi:hypothetical protein
MDYRVETNNRPDDQVYTQSFFPMVLQSIVGQGLLITEASLLHSDTPHSIELLWTSDQSHRDIYLTTHNNRRRQTSMPPAGFEPAIPGSEGPQTLVIDGPRRDSNPQSQKARGRRPLS